MIIIALVMVVGLISWGMGVGKDIVDRTINADAIITNYEWYEQQYKDIQAIEGQIKDAQASVDRFKADNGSAENWKFDQREEYARLNSIATGIQQARRKMIEDYNAKAWMITRTMWKSGNLPHHIDQ